MRNYHADNGHFADHVFINDVARDGQSITYCGVNAHFQNGIAEKRIRDLQELSASMLMHAGAKWKSAINAHLWPYALRAANDALNATPLIKGRKISQQVFCGSDAPTVLRHFHPFGCPVYVLNSKLAAGQSIPKCHGVGNEAQTAYCLARSL